MKISEICYEGAIQSNVVKLQDQATADTLNGPQPSNATVNGGSLDSDSSGQTSSAFNSRSPQSSTATSVPPRAKELDRTLRHTGLKDFATALDKAASAVFPNDKKSRYSEVYVLLVSWQTQDPELPVEQEISALRKVLESDYHYDIEEFQIPDIDSHAEVSEKVNKLVKVGNNSSSHLKIVYYAGHSRLSRTKELLWSPLPTKNNSKCPIVMWSGIQRSLEMANSDVLILLDCCSSGVANASEGNGVTELICACPFDSKANGVGHYSFTQVLTTELRFLRKKPCFSVGELYTSVYTRMQSFLPQGIENERYPPPVHFVLTHDEPFTRSIKLSVQDSRDHENEGIERGCRKRTRLRDQCDGKGPWESESPDVPNKRLCLNDDPDSRMEAIIRPWIESSQPHNNSDNFPAILGHSQEGGTCQIPEGNHAVKSADQDRRWLSLEDSMYPLDAPRALFAIRFREDIKGEDLSVELFREWLRSVPAAAEEICVEASFKCFSTLLLVTMPLSMCSYMPQHPAIYPLGPVRSSIILPPKEPVQNPSQNKVCVVTSPFMSGAGKNRKRASFAAGKHEEISKENIPRSNDEYEARTEEDLPGFERHNKQLVRYPDQIPSEGIQVAPTFEASESELVSHRKTGAMPNDSITRLLYAVLSQKCLKDIDWNKVAHDPILSQEISNGHAARVRYSRFKKRMDDNLPFKKRISRSPRLKKQINLTQATEVYVRSISDKFPMGDIDLVQRLGEANWQRHIKVRNQNRVLSQTIKGSEAKSVFQDSALGSSTLSMPSGSGYAPSASSFIIKAGEVDGNYFKVPSTPKEVADGKPFKCFICGHLMTDIKNGADWRMHIFGDIKPYVCTTPSCKDALCTFASRNEWADHEFSQHWRHSRMQVSHGHSDIERELSSLIPSVTPNENASTTISTQISSMAIFTCPLCKESLGDSDKYISHVAQHMESIALASLPLGPGENSDNNSDESTSGETEVHYDEIERWLEDLSYYVRQ